MNIRSFVLYAIALATICAATIVAGVGMKRNWFITASSRTIAAQADEGLEIEQITVRRFGFEPAAITRSAKGFMLNFSNHSGLPVLALSLNKLQSNSPVAKLTEVSLKRGQGYWTTYLNLAPGEYELAEASHPEWKCRITLTPR